MVDAPGRIEVVQELANISRHGEAVVHVTTGTRRLRAVSWGVEDGVAGWEVVLDWDGCGMARLEFVSDAQICLVEVSHG